MPSARRPSYKPGARRPSAARGEPGSSDVISASKESPAIGAATAPAAPPASDNVLSFPEPRAKRRRRILQGTIAALAVLLGPPGLSLDAEMTSGDAESWRADGERPAPAL